MLQCIKEQTFYTKQLFIQAEKMSMDRNKNLKLFSLSNKKQMNLKKKTEFVDVQL